MQDVYKRQVCKFDAIHIVDGVAKVDKDKCTGCGACANICPKQVIMIDVYKRQLSVIAVQCQLPREGSFFYFPTVIFFTEKRIPNGFSA